MKKVQLVFRGVSEIYEGPDIGLLILTDTMKERQITIVCDKYMEYQFGIRMGGKVTTDKLLPEVLTTVVKQQAEMEFEVLITDIIDGEYQCLLINKSNFESLAMRVSDAILFAIISNSPIYIDYNLMMRQSVRYSANPKGMSLPINALNDDMLKIALQNAISDENYELASALRDEIKRRKKSEEKGKEDNPTDENKESDGDEL